MSSTVIEDGPRGSSDYGSDLDAEGEEQLCRLLEDIEVQHRAQVLVLEGIDEDVNNNNTARFAIVPAIARYTLGAAGSASPAENEPWAVELDDASFGVDIAEVPAQPIQTPRLQREDSINPDSEVPDTRTPLERFRGKKPLSVTDLISPAWCELQYWYTLTKFGRKRRTPAMKQGSVVHKQLEAQVHDFVPIDTQTREDMWGLRIWNVIQGLRTLRATGMTRELEVWVVVDGQVVNGVIDELSTTCTDPEMEAKLNEAQKKGEEHVDPNQSRISQFFQSSNGDVRPPKGDQAQKIYLTDVKTRGSSTLPAGSSLRPTRIQLMIYRRMLAELASNTVNADAVFERYRLNPEVNFSDSFIAQLGSLELNFNSDAVVATHGPNEPSSDILTEIVMHNSLSQLWQLMIQQFQLAFPQGSSNISPILQAEFRSAKDGAIIGAKTFLYEEEKVALYVKDEIKWWKGEREARGVDVEEAFKCRICEFAEGCTWRITKIEQAVQKARERTKPVGFGQG